MGVVQPSATAGVAPPGRLPAKAREAALRLRSAWRSVPLALSGAGSAMAPMIRAAERPRPMFASPMPGPVARRPGSTVRSAWARRPNCAGRMLPAVCGVTMRIAYPECSNLTLKPMHPHHGGGDWQQSPWQHASTCRPAMGTRGICGASARCHDTHGSNAGPLPRPRGPCNCVRARAPPAATRTGCEGRAAAGGCSHSGAGAVCRVQVRAAATGGTARREQY